MITLETFEDRLDRWGGALHRWPVDPRREAEALLADSQAARRLLAAMTEVEASLALPAAGSVDTDSVDAVLTSRFAAVATRRAQERPASPMLRRAGWGAAIAAALALGIAVGQADLGPIGLGAGAAHDDNPDRLLASALNLGTSNADVD